jgi:5'-3' exoribonuclease 1
MGIPSYFSYIVRNHIEILRRFQSSEIIVQNLYMDCNSIIYDAVRQVEKMTATCDKTNQIIQQVIYKIEEYIAILSPKQHVFIAFDGVAPVAKLEQQRNRRYKSWYQQEILKSIQVKSLSGGSVDEVFNTGLITPGTTFMHQLNETITNYFQKNSSKYNVEKIHVSTSAEFGEGEHKIFQFIRDNPNDHTDSHTTIIYGLDADLIMLSINHLPVCPSIYLFRETPEFIKSIDNSLEPNETYLLDIPLLTSSVSNAMTAGVGLTEPQVSRVYDYIFLCFFLGNDFLPHFPALNIRTGGVDKLLNAYKFILGGTNELLTDGQTIYWKNVRKLVAHLGDLEEEYIKTEMKLRDRREKLCKNSPTETDEQKFAKFESIPNYERELEKYINPFKDGWQRRYYKCLLKMDNDEERCQSVSINYLEGLEWTMKYYTTGCVDWRWCYQHNYPPLLKDLLRYIPYFEREFLPKQLPNPVSELVQLCYVTPRECLRILPRNLHDSLLKKRGEFYPKDCEFIWSYCKYFWECHCQLPHIDINDLERFVMDAGNLGLLAAPATPPSSK